jgi:chromosome segregation ATPase
MTDQPNLFLLTEAAERTGLTVDALRKRVKRGKLQTVKGNDGLVRVRLTGADMASLRLDDGQPTASHSEEKSRRDSSLEAEVAALRQRVEQLQAEREEARIRAAYAEGEAKALREAVAREIRQAEQAEEARRVAETQLGAAQATRDATQAELAAWTAGGPLARTWRAFWSRRGRP